MDAEHEEFAVGEGADGEGEESAVADAWGDVEGDAELVIELAVAVALPADPVIGHAGAGAVVTGSWQRDAEGDVAAGFGFLGGQCEVDWREMGGGG